MKKNVTLILILILILTMAACNPETGTNIQTPTEPSYHQVSPAPQTQATEPVQKDDGLDPYVKMLMSDHYYASGGESSDFKYIIYTCSRDDSGYIIIKEYLGTDATVVIPDTLDGFPVIGMYHSIFDNTSFVSDITFPDSLRTVIFNTRADTDQCMVGTAWYQQQPDGVYYAGNVAVGCKGNGEITLREGTVGIGGAAFRLRKDLTSIDFPASLLMISDDAFAGSGLTEITIPATLQYYFGAFGSCYALEKVVFEEGITEITGTVSGSSVKEVVLPTTLEIIGKNAFMHCEELQHITLPANVKTIDALAFYGSGLTSITLNDGLETIGKEAFQHCKGLKSIYIPASVKDIGLLSVGYNLDDEPIDDFIAYFPTTTAAMEDLQRRGVNCQIGLG